MPYTDAEETSTKPADREPRGLLQDDLGSLDVGAEGDVRAPGAGRDVRVGSRVDHEVGLPQQRPDGVGVADVADDQPGAAARHAEGLVTGLGIGVHAVQDADGASGTPEQRDQSAPDESAAAGHDDAGIAELVEPGADGLLGGGSGQVG